MGRKSSLSSSYAKNSIKPRHRVVEAYAYSKQNYRRIDFSGDGIAMVYFIFKY